MRRRRCDGPDMPWTWSRSDEAGVARLIALLDRQGDRAGALAVYAALERRLADEFSALPSPETRALMQALRQRPTPAGMARPAEQEETAPPTLVYPHDAGELVPVARCRRGAPTALPTPGRGDDRRACRGRTPHAAGAGAFRRPGQAGAARNGGGGAVPRSRLRLRRWRGCVREWWNC